MEGERWKGNSKGRREERKDLYQFSVLENYTRTNTQPGIYLHVHAHTHANRYTVSYAHGCTHLHTSIHRDAHGTSFQIYPVRLKVRGCSCGIRSKSKLEQDGWARVQGWGNHAQCFHVGQKSKVDPRMALLGGSQLMCLRPKSIQFEAEGCFLETSESKLTNRVKMHHVLSYQVSQGLRCMFVANPIAVCKCGAGLELQKFLAVSVFCRHLSFSQQSTMGED